MTTKKKPAGSANYQTGQSAVFLSLHRHHSAAVARLKVLAVGFLSALPAMAGGFILLAGLAVMLEALT